MGGGFVLQSPKCTNTVRRYSTNWASWSARFRWAVRTTVNSTPFGVLQALVNGRSLGSTVRRLRPAPRRFRLLHLG